jgi:hypothetical protein
MRANRLAGNVVLVRDTDTLPDAKPLAWREVNRNSLTRFSHLLRLCLSLEGLVILVCLIGFGGGIIDLPVAVLWLVLTLGPLFMAVKAANLFAGERAAQTLSVLLTIPVSGKRIVKEKMAGLSRLHLAYLIPLATLAITVAVMKSSSRVYLEPRIAGYVPHEGAPSVVVVLVDAVVKVRALVWFSVWVGLRIKSRGRAVVLVVLIALAWRFLGPAVLYDATHGFEFGIWLITIGAHVFVLLAARYMSFRGLDEYMGRLSGEKGLLERFTEWAVGQPVAEPDGAGEEVERC